MIKMFKLRYMLCWRVDSQNFLKILIIFNIFLGLYLLFLSTDRRRVSEYPLTNQPKVVAESLKKDDAEPPSVSVVKTNNTKANPVDQSEIKVSNGFSNDQLSVVEKIYDSNNKLVVQEPDKNDDVKRVEEDDKTLDEIDKLRIEMIDKQGNLGNSIIHDLEFSDDKQHKSAAKNDSTNVAKANDYLSKDVINRILDHNQHINKNTSKLISPDSVTAESFWWSLEKHGNYQVLRDYIPGNIPSSFDMKSITLTTQGTSDFLHHAEQLCDRWDGFISLAVYAPGDDFRLAINIIYYLRQCTNRCISDRVYWHMVFDSQYAPINISTPASYLEAQNFDCNLPLKDTLKSLKLSSDFRKFKSLPYPINVLRNVARNATKTKYLLASDIELYPSIGIVPAFFDLLERERIGQVPLINANNPHVYVLPIFETKSTKKSPRTKTELSTLFHSRDAIFFHRYVCDACQNFPGRDIWIKQIPDKNDLNIFAKTHRYRDRNQWEPLYIGTNAEPFYDERLTWDGKRDKMSQMYEMCLMNYDLLILDNAFLVHAPGIKFHSAKDDNKRMPFIIANQKVHVSLLSNLRKKYGTKNRC